MNCLRNLCALILLSTSALGQVPTPESVIGHPVGADYKLARWDRVSAYFDALGKASDRVQVTVTDRRTTEGRDFLVVAISSPENLKNIDRYKAMQARLSDPRKIAGDAERRDILDNAKATILVSCGLHSSEVSATQMSMELAYDLATRDDAEVREILEHCIIVLIPCVNPDGLDKIVDWYESNLGTPFEGAPMPWLYQKYAGHDNNRDWFMLNLVETQILTEQLYFNWHPTILHDVHQMGNRHARFFVPPFFDPVNPNVDPLIHQSLLLIGGHMATRLQEEGRTGVVFKAVFDNWWQGGNRTTPYRHNIVGILTECASAKYASPIFQEHRQLRGGGRGFPSYAPAVNFPDPWPGGWWRLRDAVEYQKSSNFALFQLAARYRDRFVKNHLTLSEKALRLGREEPPFAWLVPSEQRDPAATAHMLETLRNSGIEVHRATAAFEADGVEYPGGTYVLLAEQPFRPHLKDMMERQLYPQRRQYPDGPAEPPYDVAGWTLPLQMGVKTVTVVRPFEAQLAAVDRVQASAIVREWKSAGGGGQNVFGGDGPWLPVRGCGDFAALNAMLEAGEELHAVRGGGVVMSVEQASRYKQQLRDLGGQMTGRPDQQKIFGKPGGPRMMGEPVEGLLQRPRVGLYQPWTASMDEGWTRLALEKFNFAYDTLHNAEIRAGDLRSRYDCIIIPDLSADSLLNGRDATVVPPPYAGGIGPDGAMQLERFVRAGGTLVLMDSATQFATETLRLPVRNVLKDLKQDTFFCPGSLLRIRVDNTHPLGYGFEDEAAAYFARSQAFAVGEEALKTGDDRKLDEAGKRKLAEQPVTVVARYADNLTLMSGFLLGEEHVRDKAAICEVRLGTGRVVLFGFRVQHRGQPWSTFKFLFNAIYGSVLPTEAWGEE